MCLDVSVWPRVSVCLCTMTIRVCSTNRLDTPPLHLLARTASERQARTHTQADTHSHRATANAPIRHQSISPGAGSQQRTQSREPCTYAIRFMVHTPSAPLHTHTHINMYPLYATSTHTHTHTPLQRGPRPPKCTHIHGGSHDEGDI